MTNIDKYYDDLRNKIDIIYWEKEKELKRSIGIIISDIQQIKNNKSDFNELDYSTILKILEEKKDSENDKCKEYEKLYLKMISEIENINKQNRNEIESIQNRLNSKIYDIDFSICLKNHCMFIPNEDLFENYAKQNKIGLLVTSDWYLTENHMRFIRFAFENKHKKFILVECDKVIYICLF